MTRLTLPAALRLRAPPRAEPGCHSGPHWGIATGPRSVIVVRIQSLVAVSRGYQSQRTILLRPCAPGPFL